MSGIIWVVAAVTFGASLCITWLSRSYALRRALLDVPNTRSSHVVATPRGGGMAIVISVLAVAAWLFAADGLSDSLFLALSIGGAAVAIIGWVDDHRPLGIGMRAGVHLLAAACAVVILDTAADPQLPPGHAEPFRWLMGVLYVVALAWLINLYNFLDGIDGYAGTQAVCVGLAGAVIFGMTGETGAALLCVAVAAACAGFLCWNWAPARIFMGDVGSYFLGYTFGVLALYGERSGSVSISVWLILLGVFVIDATLTLLRRLLAGERWYDAHRAHAYQRLHQMGWTHQRIALGLLALNIVVLWPMAGLAVLWDNLAVFVLAICMAVLGVLWLAINNRFDKKSMP